MKRIILILTVLCLCCEQPIEVSGMPSVYTPPNNSNPATITIPSDGDNANAASVNGALEALADKAQYIIAFADIPGQTGAIEGTKVYVGETSWYEYTASTPFTADGFWVITATGMGAGQWINGLIASVNLKKLPSVGPVPGESFTFPTATGHINADLVPYGHFEHGIDSSHHQYTTTSGSVVTLATLFTAANVGTNYIIHFRANCVARGNSAAAFNFIVFIELSEDNGSTWTSMTNNGGGSFRADANNTQQSIPLDFTSIMGSSVNTIQIRLRAVSDGTHTLVVDISNISLWINRP